MGSSMGNCSCSYSCCSKVDTLYTLDSYKPDIPAVDMWGKLDIAPDKNTLRMVAYTRVEYMG